jgi:competence ComEA-like helix-hairpin-helix protein
MTACRPKRKLCRFAAVGLATVAVLSVAMARPCAAGGWPEVKIRLLPDDCFALVEYDPNGVKIRHCPHHDAAGRLDAEQLIWVLGTLDSVKWIYPRNKGPASRHLEKHFDRYKSAVAGQAPLKTVNINAAALTHLVTLPQIGPKLAVKIAQYREDHKRFRAIDEIQKIEGIGPATFAALRHYITIE